MIALLPLTILGQGSSIRALNGLGTNITLRGQNIIRTNLLVDATGTNSIGSSNVLEVVTKDGTKALQVATNGPLIAADSITSSNQFLGQMSATVPFLSIAGGTTSGWRVNSINDWYIRQSGTDQYQFNGNYFTILDGLDSRVRFGSDGKLQLYRVANGGLEINTNFTSIGTITTSNLTVLGTANVATNLIVHTNTYIGPTNAAAVTGKTYVKVDGGAAGLVFDYTTNSVNKAYLDTQGNFYAARAIQSDRIVNINAKNDTSNYGIGLSSFVNLGAVDNAGGNEFVVTVNGKKQASFSDSATLGITITNVAKFGSWLTATGGLASFSTVAAVSIAATGWTNIWSTNNAVVYMDATASLAYYVKNNAGTSVYTNVSSAASINGTVMLQPGGAVVITGGTSPTGRATPF